jgi:hypothetical protein
LRRPRSLADEVPASTASILFLNVCASIAESEYEKRFCQDLVSDFMNHLGGLLDIANRIELIMSGFELKGRCLIKKGVSVEDPSVCEGSVDDGLVVVGRGMQFFVNRDFRSAVYRVDGACTVAVGAVPNLYEIETVSKAKKPGVAACYKSTAYVAVGPCSFSDLPKLAEKAADLAEGRYSEIYERCHQRWKDARSEEVVSLVEELTHKRHLELLEEGERR